MYAANYSVIIAAGRSAIRYFAGSLLVFCPTGVTRCTVPGEYVTFVVVLRCHCFFFLDCIFLRDCRK